MTSLSQQHNTWSQQQYQDNNAMMSLLEEEQGSTSSTAPVRKRTRATADQLSVLEDTFAVNVSPNSKLRKQLAAQLSMSERSIQIWFQNRRAKVKHMQKRAQMQMHQASIRAQLYQYHHHQQQQSAAATTILPMQQQQQQGYYNPATAARLAAATANTTTTPTTRAQSVDTYNRMPTTTQMHQHHHHQQQQLYTPASSVPPHSNYSPPPPPHPSSLYYSQHGSVPPSWPSTMMVDDLIQHPFTTRASMPPFAAIHNHHQGLYDGTTTSMDFPEYLHGQVSPSPSPLHKQQTITTTTIPTLISVPDAGPTAVLATTTQTQQPSKTSSSPSYNASSPPDTTQTIDPSSLLISSPTSDHQDVKEEEAIDTKDDYDKKKENHPTKEEKEQEQKQQEEEEPKDLYLSATTLTIGTWHRLKMHETDLVCVYRPDTKTFAWHIVDGGCHFKMEVAQEAVSSIEFLLGDHVADVHFDISEPPLFYMESAIESKKKNSNEQETTTVWVQCSDFTEGKQASRFFRHTLKGIAPHMKQELMALIHNHEETRRLVHFIELQQPYSHPFMYPPQQLYPPPPPPPPPSQPQSLQSYYGLVSPEEMAAQQMMQQQQQPYMMSTPYWNPLQQASPDATACELYMS